ncbi:MAG: biotin/lipoyl-binding protein [Bacteroidota bacterium]
MIKKSLFVIVTLTTAAVLMFYSQVKRDGSLAVVAEVEPQKTAISFHKPVRVKSVHVKPGQHVKTGDLLLTVERPDLMLDIQKANNNLAQLRSELAKLNENFKSTLEVRRIRYYQQITELNKRKQLLKESLRVDSSFYNQFSDTSKLDLPAYQIKLQELNDQLNLEKSKFQSETNRNELVYQKDTEVLNLRLERMNEELTTLEQEKQSLKQYATINGTIGSVGVQLMELIPPYKTIMTVYEEHPSLIKAYINEKAELGVIVGDTVAVSSINRNYNVVGNVVEIGSRIVSYPRQMNPFGQQQMWGREVFVQIAKDHAFLSGEKVYVLLEAP